MLRSATKGLNMHVETVSAEYASKYSQAKRFGVISEGCTGVWGEGDTLGEAKADAVANMVEGCGVADLAGCWVMEIGREG